MVETTGGPPGYTLDGAGTWPAQRTATGAEDDDAAQSDVSR